MNIGNITEIANSITYQNIFKQNEYFENGYNLFLSKFDEENSMYDALMNTYTRKYKDDINKDFVFIQEEYMDLYVEKNLSNNDKESLLNHKRIDCYYPSSISQNLLFFYGLEEHYNKLWYAYYDISDYIYIFVDVEFNDQFKKSYIVDRIGNYDEKTIYLKMIERMNFANQSYIVSGYFYTKRREDI